MNISLQPGTYVVAVSGGVDSVALLHLLHAIYMQSTANYRFVVAHFDHGIRDDAAEDRRLVQQLAQDYTIPVVYDEGRLGATASEATAREARYTFLHHVRVQAKADAIITAHHQDDVLETALLNMMRGTNRKGISSLKSTDIVRRPLLHMPKQDIVAYAKAHNLQWREDSTNSDERYKRNFVRRQLMTKLTPEQRAELLRRISDIGSLNKLIDAELELHLEAQPHSTALSRRYITALPHALSMELMAAWLRSNKITTFDKRTLLRIVVLSQVLSDGQQIDVNRRYFISVSTNELKLTSRHH